VASSQLLQRIRPLLFSSSCGFFVIFRNTFTLLCILGWESPDWLIECSFYIACTHTHTCIQVHAQAFAQLHVQAQWASPTLQRRKRHSPTLVKSELCGERNKFSFEQNFVRQTFDDLLHHESFLQ
jgi:hypothetical protein